MPLIIIFTNCTSRESYIKIDKKVLNCYTYENSFILLIYLFNYKI